MLTNNNPSRFGLLATVWIYAIWLQENALKFLTRYMPSILRIATILTFLISEITDFSKLNKLLARCFSTTLFALEMLTTALKNRENRQLLDDSRDMYTNLSEDGAIGNITIEEPQEGLLSHGLKKTYKKSSIINSTALILNTLSTAVPIAEYVYSSTKGKELPNTNTFVPIELALGVLSLLIYYVNQTLVESNLEDQRVVYDRANASLGCSYKQTALSANLNPQPLNTRYHRSCTII